MVQMRLAYLLPAAALLVANPAVAQPISVPSDPRARYEALEIAPRRNGLLEIVTRRDGPSGTSFAVREVDCRGDRFRYVGEGDTLVEAKRRTDSNRLAPLVEGSISWHVARFACRSVAR